MPVYFIAENENDDYQRLRVKIGRSGDIKLRLQTFQTGSPYELKLMGWIESDSDSNLEAALHNQYASRRVHLEWFELAPEHVLNELKAHGINAYIATEANTFEIISRDKDGVAEFMGPWKWGGVDDSDFCPKCGCSCGLQDNDNYGTARCLKCGIIYEYEEDEGDGEY
ncbi:GIY-YIG nuclease family protein [Paraburkholderia caribensis]|uniref:GIY-YIG nuclease family protein n=1 Tax=Paraburkholderia caribensis TaxID=75105 RepID=UPI0015925613|nr:GIY-YIG nuclease family protein [Paraburkholderia caribensis]